MADVGVKHASALGARSIEEEASDAIERGMASALIVTGVATGSPASKDDVKRVKDAVPGAPVFVGSGVTLDSLASQLSVADGIIVGSHVMKDGTAGGPIDPSRARALVAASGRQ